MAFVPSKARVKLEENPCLYGEDRRESLENLYQTFVMVLSLDIQTITMPKQSWNKMAHLINSKKCILLLLFFPHKHNFSPYSMYAGNQHCGKTLINLQTLNLEFMTILIDTGTEHTFFKICYLLSYTSDRPVHLTCIINAKYFLNGRQLNIMQRFSTLQLCLGALVQSPESRQLSHYRQQVAKG